MFIVECNKYVEKMEEDKKRNETDFAFKVPELRKKERITDSKKRKFFLPTSSGTNK